MVDLYISKDTLTDTITNGLEDVKKPPRRLFTNFYSREIFFKKLVLADKEIQPTWTTDREVKFLTILYRVINPDFLLKFFDIDLLLILGSPQFIIVYDL